MKNRSVVTVLFLACASFLCLSASLFGREEDKLAEISRCGVSQAKLLRSVQFDFTTNISGLGVDRGTCSVSGGKFHSSLSHERSDVGLLPSESAFNGDKFQLLDRIENGIGEYLSCSSTPILPSPSGTLDPLMLPYSWLFISGQPPQWSLVKDDTVWNKAFSEAEYLGTETVEGHSCETVRFPGTLPNTANTVYFAADLHCFPFKVVVAKSDGSFSGFVQLVEYERTEVDGGLLIIPTKLKFSHVVDGNEVPGESAITAGTLKVNQPIDDGKFTISPTRAKRVIDLDGQKAMFERLEPNRPLHGLSFSVTRAVLIGLGLLFVAFPLYRFFRKRNGTKKSAALCAAICLLIVGAVILRLRVIKNRDSAGYTGYKKYEILVNVARTLNDAGGTRKVVGPQRDELLAEYSDLLETVESEFGGAIPPDGGGCDALRPDETPIAFFMPVFRLLMFKAGSFEAGGTFGESCQWNVLLMNTGLIANMGADVESSSAMVYCFDKAVSSICRQIEDPDRYSSGEGNSELLKALVSLDDSLVAETSTERAQDKIRKSRIYVEAYLRRPAYNRDCCRTLLAFCMAKLLLADYRFRNGSYPDRLRECLPPVYSRDLFAAPWELIYRKEGDSYVLYSCGPDGADDRGLFKPFERLALGEKGDLKVPEY